MKGLSSENMKKLTLNVQKQNYNVKFLDLLWLRINQFKNLQEAHFKLKIPKIDDDISYGMIAGCLGSF